MLVRFAQGDGARFCMPGHKGRAVTPVLGAAELDVTELSPTGNLYLGGDAIERAEALWARAWGFPHCQFLTGGATQGLHAGLLLCARRGREILVDRCAHRAAFHGMALWDMSPVYLPRRQDEPVPPEAVEGALRAHPGVKTVCITSPTYYGVLSDIATIGAVCRRHGAALLVDGAHGAHLPFLGKNPFLGADLAVTSPHKTLPVYGQGAVLFGGEGFPAPELRRAAAVTGTSSPSYPILASLDLARGWMEKEGRAAYRAAVEFVDRCRRNFSALSGENLDPARLTLVSTLPGGGFAAQKALEEQGIWPEMADRDHLVCIVTGCERPEHRENLYRALAAGGWFGRGTAGGDFPAPPEPEVAMSPRAALLTRRERLPLRAAEGRIAAEGVAPYPPGVPVIAPGERVTKKALAYLAEMGYNVDIPVEVCGDGLSPEGDEEG